MQLLQQTAGNAAVGRMLSAARPLQVQRWQNLGTESWKLQSMTRREMTVWTGTKEEWSSRLDDIDDQSEYQDGLWGFLVAANDPSVVGRTRPPSHISSDAESVQYANTIRRAPSDAEKVALLAAMYEKSGDLDLWHGGSFEGGPWIHFADRDLADFISTYQGLYLAEVSRSGRTVDAAGATAVAAQGGRQATMAMIVNAGATAHKAVDLLMSANRLEGLERETANSQALELVRNSGRTIRSALVANDARVAFEEAVVSGVFDHVWGLIPGGGHLVEAGKALLKAGLGAALKKATADETPGDQAETINAEFVSTCNSLVRAGHIASGDVQDAINGFEAVRR